MRIVWDQDKRQTNRAKHGLDFIDSAWVLDSPYRLDVVSGIISFRPASE